MFTIGAVPFRANRRNISIRSCVNNGLFNGSLSAAGISFRNYFTKLTICSFGIFVIAEYSLARKNITDGYFFTVIAKALSLDRSDSLTGVNLTTFVLQGNLDIASEKRNWYLIYRRGNIFAR